MEKYIALSPLVAEIERRIADNKKDIELASHENLEDYFEGYEDALALLKQQFLDSIEVKEVDLDLEKRIKECPFRQVTCNRYEEAFVECDGRCSWVTDYPKLKELKVQNE